MKMMGGGFCLRLISPSPVYMAVDSLYACNRGTGSAVPDVLVACADEYFAWTTKTIDSEGCRAIWVITFLVFLMLYLKGAPLAIEHGNGRVAGSIQLVNGGIRIGHGHALGLARHDLVASLKLQ